MLVSIIYKAENGDSVLTNVKNYESKKYSRLEKTTQYESVKAIQKSMSEEEYKIELYKRKYIEWVMEGRLGVSPLEPEKITKQILFNPNVYISIWNGKGLISTKKLDFDFQYENYTDCMNDEQRNINEIKKHYTLELRSDVIYPKNLTKKYSYECFSELTKVNISLITPKIKKEIEEYLKNIMKPRNYFNEN